MLSGCASCVVRGDDRMINKYSNMPMYSQLKGLILQKIESGGYPEGSRIPSEEDLCETYGISRPTVRQAIHELTAGGWLYREKGKGTYVSKRNSCIRIRKYNGFYGSLLAESIPACKRQQISIHRVTAGEVPILQEIFFGIDPGSAFVCSEFLILEEEEPIARIGSYMPLALFPDMLEGLQANRPMLDLLKGKYPFLPHAAKSSLEITSAGTEDSPLLHVHPGQSLLKVTSAIHAKGGQVVEVVVSLFRGDKCRIMLENTLHG
ncbi:MAG TPA: GntR family transcriptional regulator [Clostridiales bacterium]|nr:GntR family transcriptional regulator [Clostridiales bacterium]